MKEDGFRPQIIEYIRANALPVEKFSHQPRVYELSKQIAGNAPFDDDILFAAAWLHDIGVFIGHRPENPEELARWDMLAYATRKVPSLLRGFGYPPKKIPSVVEAIRTHQPAGEPQTVEGVLLRDADILEQLGATGILRTVCKIGRDTRFADFTDALRVLRKNRIDLPPQLRLASARELAAPRIGLLQAFLEAAEVERCSDLQPERFHPQSCG